MRITYVIVLATLCVNFCIVESVFAQGFSKTQIKQYKNACLSQHSVGLSSGAAKAYCNCMTRKVIANFTPSEVLNQDALTHQKIRSVAQVPCLTIPVRNITFNRCLRDKAVEIYSSQKENICNCVAEKSGRYISQRIAKIIAQSDTETNLASIILNNQDFNRNLTSNISICVQGVGY